MTGVVHIDETIPAAPEPEAGWERAPELDDTKGSLPLAYRTTESCEPGCGWPIHGLGVGSRKHVVWRGPDVGQDDSPRGPAPRCDGCGRFMAEPAATIPIRDSVHPYTADVQLLCGGCADRSDRA